MNEMGIPELDVEHTASSFVGTSLTALPEVQVKSVRSVHQGPPIAHQNDPSWWRSWLTKYGRS